MPGDRIEIIDNGTGTVREKVIDEIVDIYDSLPIVHKTRIEVVSKTSLNNQALKIIMCPEQMENKQIKITKLS